MSRESIIGECCDGLWSWVWDLYPCATWPQAHRSIFEFSSGSWTAVMLSVLYFLTAAHSCFYSLFPVCKRILLLAKWIRPGHPSSSSWVLAAISSQLSPSLENCLLLLKSSLTWKVMPSCSQLLTNVNGVLLSEYLGSTKIHMLKLYPLCDGIWRQGFERWLGQEGGVFMNGISALTRDPRVLLVPSVTWGHNEKTV